MRSPERVVVLAGGYGGAKMAHGLALEAKRRGSPDDLTLCVNVADDLDVHGLHVSPDLDTVMYTLAGLANPDTGWGVRDETWSAAAMLERYGAETWFRLGDRDLATSILRTDRLRAGERLTDVTTGLARALDVPARLLPATDHPVHTRVRTDAGWHDFQEYFVQRRHEDTVRELRYKGVEDARPTPEVLDAIASAELVVLAPSNPYLSIAPILALPGVLDALTRSAAPTFAVSPIVGGRALRGPADRILESLGGEASAAGVARHYVGRYPGLLDALVIDLADEHEAESIERLRLGVIVAPTVMRDEEDRRRLAEHVLAAAGSRLTTAARRRVSD